MLNGTTHIGELAAIGKRVGRDIEDAHDHAPLVEFMDGGADEPSLFHRAIRRQSGAGGNLKTRGSSLARESGAFRIGVLMPKPATILLILLALGGLGALWLVPGPRPGSGEKTAGTEENGVASEHRFMVGEAPTVEDLQKQMALLEGQVEYLQGQVSVLQDENEALIRKLGSIGLPGGAKMEPVVALPDDAAPDFVGLGLELMRLRQIQALPTPTISGTVEDVEALVLASLRNWQDGEAAQLFTGALAALGWIPQPVDLQPLQAALLARIMGAWLDEATDTVVTVEPGSLPTMEVDATLGVAVAHLIREFSGILLQNAKGLTTDERLSRLGLLFGDAALSRLLYEIQQPARLPSKGKLSPNDPDHPLNQVPLPVFLRELTTFPIQSGMEFAQSLHNAGGFPQLDSAYSRPPASSREVLDVEKYLNDQELVIEVGPKEVRIEGVSPYWDDELGQFICLTALRAHNEDHAAYDGVEGWLADRLLVYPVEGEGRDHACWQTLWRDKGTATAFFKAMSRCLAERYGAKVDDAEVRFEKDGRVVRLLRMGPGARVVLIDAASTAWAESLEALCR